MKHNIKTLSTFYKGISSGKKTFEVRLNDRNYQVGDLLHHTEIDDDTKIPTGEECETHVTYILNDKNYCKDGYVVMAIETSVNYSIYTPSKNGYDVEGRYYECDCGANYIDIEKFDEWIYCPYCGNRVASEETLSCADCEHAEYDGDSYYCEHKDGKNRGENVDNMNFDGCKHWGERK